jgi:uncharacterized protein
MPIKRIAYLGLGWLSLVAGVIGIFLPLLPTTPFVLLSAWCFSRSSRRFHAWLTEHRFFGPIVRDWQSGLGIPRKTRNRALILMWLSMGLSMYLVGRPWATFALISIGIMTSVMLLRLPIKKQ